jgi:hypothetical protein
MTQMQRSLTQSNSQPAETYILTGNPSPDASPHTNRDKVEARTAHCLHALLCWVAGALTLPYTPIILVIARRFAVHPDVDVCSSLHIHGLVKQGQSSKMLRVLVSSLCHRFNIVMSVSATVFSRSLLLCLQYDTLVCVPCLDESFSLS